MAGSVLLEKEETKRYIEQSSEFAKALNLKLLKYKFRHAPSQVRDLINDCLQLNPAKRKSAGELIQSPLFNELRMQIKDRAQPKELVLPVDLLKEHDYNHI